MNASNVLFKVAEQGLNSSTREEFIALACAYWHEDFFPDMASVKNLPHKQQLIIGYLTEFFSTFNVVEKERAIRLVEFSNALKNQLKPVSNDNNADEIAAEWGLAENINEHHQHILFYQTRHYEHGS